MIITNHVAQQDSISFYTPPQTLTPLLYTARNLRYRKAGVLSTPALRRHLKWRIGGGIVAEVLR